MLMLAVVTAGECGAVADEVFNEPPGGIDDAIDADEAAGAADDLAGNDVAVAAAEDVQHAAAGQRAADERGEGPEYGGVFFTGGGDQRHCAVVESIGE